MYRLGLVAVVALGVAGQEAYPPTKPLLQIETGMHTAVIRSIDTDAAARYLVSASDDKTARVWDVDNGKLLQVLRPPQGEGNAGRLRSVAVSPDGTIVAVGGDTGPLGSKSVHLFDRETGKLLSRVDQLPNVVEHLSYSRDGRYLSAVIWGKNGVRVFRTSDLREVGRDVDYGGDSYWAEFDADGRLVTTSWDGFVRLYSADFHLIAKQSARGGKQPYSARFSPDGSRIAVGFADSTAVNVLSGRDLRFLYGPNTSQVTSGSLLMFTWSRDGNTLYGAGQYADSSDWCQILSWDRRGEGAVRSFRASYNTVTGLLAMSSGRLAFASQDPALGVMDSEGRVVWQNTPDIAQQLGNAAKLRVAGDGSIAEFGFDVFDQSGRLSRHTAKFDVVQRQLKIDPSSNQRLTSPNITGLPITNWMNSYEPALRGRKLPFDQYEISRSLAISAPADSFLLGSDWYLRFFNREGKEKWHVPAPGVAWAVTTDGGYAVAAFGDGTLRWYTVDKGQEVLALFVHRDGRWVAWTPEGFFASSPGGESLVGYHINHGPDHEGEFVKVDQLLKPFYRPDLISQALKPEGAAVIAAARKEIGDIAAVLASPPPELELLSPTESQTDGDFLFQVRAKNRGGGVGRVVYKVDGQEIQGRAVDIPGVGPDTLSQRFPLGPGRHEIVAKIYNGRNLVASQPVKAIVNVTTPQQAPALYVVAAGVSDYRDHALSQGVKFAASDADTLASRLKAQGQGLFRDVVTYPLTNAKATRQNIENAVAEVASRIKPVDVFILYLAGHGMAIDGKYHFIPWEVRYTSEDALKQQAMNQDVLQDLLKRVQVGKVLLLLDTCSSAAIFGRDLQIGDKGAIDRLAKLSGRAILAATASDKMALEGYNGHGVFTYALLEGLAKAGNTQGLVQVSGLAEFVEELVPKITLKQWNYEQFPMLELQGQTFPIARKP